MFRPFYSLIEGADRLAQSLSDVHRNRGRRSRWITRTAGLAIVAAALTQLIPTLADETTPPPNEGVVAADVPLGETVVVLGSSEDLSFTGGDNSAVMGGDEGEITYATSETETANSDTPSEIQVVADQGVALRIPAVIKVDPRSVTALLPAISMAGEETLLLCISGASLKFDLASKGFVDDTSRDELIVDGDLTGDLRISGAYEQVSALVNGAGGLRVWSTNRVVAGKDAAFAAVVLTGVAVNKELCGSQATVRTLQIRALGLGLETKKSDVSLK